MHFYNFILKENKFDFFLLLEEDEKKLILLLLLTFFLSKKKGCLTSLAKKFDLLLFKKR